MIRAVIIDDEINSRELLEQLIEIYCKSVEIIGMAVDVSSGIQLIIKTKPKLVFLDVEMPGGTGFDILKNIAKIDFSVIFVTGYDHYAIRAIKFSALDYLLKPVNIEELQRAVEIVADRHNYVQERLDVLQSNLETNESLERFVLSGTKNHLILKLDDILYIESKGPYVTFYVDDDDKHVTINSLNFYEELFSESCLFRIHKSFIVNCKKIVKFDVGRGGNVYLINDITIPIAVRRKTDFLRFLEDYS